MLSATYQYRLTAAHTLLSLRKGKNVRHEMGKGMPEEEGTLLRVLNWMALCISFDSKQNTAVAIHRDLPGRRLVFYIACDTSRDSTILLAASSLVKILSDAYDDHLRGADMTVADTRLQDFMAENCWSRIHAKLDRLALVHSADGVGLVPAFNALVDSWEAWRASSGLAGENSVALRSHAETMNLPDATAALKEILPFLISTDGHISGDSRPPRLWKILARCYALVVSDFYRDFRKERWIPETEDGFLRKVFRKVWRIYFYQKSANYVIDRGLNYLSAEILHGATDYTFAVEWVAEAFASPSDCTVTLDTDPEQHLDEIATRYASRFARNDGKRPSLSPLNYAPAWSPPSTHQLYIHPEAQMLNFLAMNGISVLNKEIGLSKRPCVACEYYVSPSMAWEFIYYRVTRASGKARPDWMIPPLAHAVKVHKPFCE